MTEAVELTDKTFRPLTDDEIAATAPPDAAPVTADVAKAQAAADLVAQCKPITGTPAEVYLSGRGIRTDNLPRQTLGWHPERRILVCVAKNAEGRVSAVQRILLNDDGSAVIEDGKKKKLSLGAIKGAAMILPGDGGEILVTEGPEDALSLWRATGMPVRATFGAAGIGEAPLPDGATAVIVADNDPPGSPTHALIQKAAKRLQDRGHMVKVARPPEGVKDSNDLLRERGAEAVKAMVCAAVEIPAPSSNSGIVEPEGFHMEASGLYAMGSGRNAAEALVCAPFQIVGKVRDPQGGGWGLCLRWENEDSVWREATVSNDKLFREPSDALAPLVSGGLYIDPAAASKQAVAKYLLSVRVRNRIREVEQPGWFRDCYVTSAQVYGDTGGEAVILRGRAQASTKSGSLQGWRDEVAALAVNNSRFALAICAALAGPLLRLVSSDSFAFHLCGASSGGKSTALHIGSSLFGSPVRSWKSTANGVEGMATEANDNCLLLDEFGMLNDRDAGDAAYLLGNGVGKVRMTRTGEIRPPATWKLVALSSGELGVSQKVEAAGQKAKAGMEVRIIEVPADAGAGMKMIECLHGFPGGAALSDHLRSASERHRGHAGAAYLERLTDAVKRNGADQIAQGVRERCDEWIGRLELPANADGQATRVAARFAIAAAAGSMATHMGVLPWPPGYADEAAKVCFRAWLENRGGVGSGETEAGLSQVRAFIEAHGASRFQAIDREGERVINRVGYTREGADGRRQYLVLPEAWKNEVCKGQDAKAVARDLIARGLLLPDKEGKAARSERIDGGSRRVYVLTSDILGG